VVDGVVVFAVSKAPLAIDAVELLRRSSSGHGSLCRMSLELYNIFLQLSYLIFSIFSSSLMWYPPLSIL
jgi:hypothetical protein